MTTPRPNLSPSELAQIQRDFVPVRTRHWVCLYSGIALALIGLAMKQGDSDAGTIPIVLGFCLAIFAIGTWNCPVCKAHFGKNWIKGYCPSCGTQLTE